MPVTDDLVALFERAGLDTVFGFPCEQMDPYYASIADAELRHVLARSEASAAVMADGYARASGRVGVVDGVGGPGAANLGVGLVEAAGASSPVLALTGDNPVATRGDGVIQDADNRAILDPYVKTGYDAVTPDRAVADATAALREAVGGVPGPVHLNVPEDVLRAETNDDSEERAVSARFPAERPRPALDDVDRTVDRLRNAERPVVVAGEGVHRAGAQDALVAFVEATNTPVVTSMNGKGAVAETEPYALGVVGRWGFCQVANDAVEDADLVLALGCRLGELTTVGWSLLDDDAAVVHVDRDPAWLGRNYDADVAMAADLRAAIEALTDALDTDDFAGRASRVESLAADRANWYEHHRDELESERTPIRPARVVEDIGVALPENGVLVSATSYSGFFSGAFFEVPRAGLGYVQARGSDGINYALPQALGVQVARPDDPVVALTGDGGVGYHVADLETAVREDLPVTVVVADNAMLGSSKASQLGNYAVDQSTDFAAVDYAQVARGFGCDAERIEDPTRLAGALAEAIDSDRPTLLDVVVDPYAAPPVLV
ncbi:thiamine pyrophosphate-binding protein [Halomarina oriensis]|uniref:Thiamine pyrophosphate-binding protein n=1 Tax=Halomarina oriensis TaxID=671145 RepID=A0A6B0GTR6_9EURY|nr:thiamine pyrophosphate-binding protein [Halomarina oriensis]MWG36767.1 thiamine pyrophosphate-binding protein [Halomarina oriensis]